MPSKKQSRERKRNPFKRFFKRHLTSIVVIIFVTIGLLSLISNPFNNTPKKVIEKQAVVINHKSNINELDKLTKKLLVEQEKTELLRKKLDNQSLKLKDLLKKALVKTGSKDQKYIDALEKTEEYKKHVTKVSSNINQTDYYNKVRVSLSSRSKGDQLQSKVNKYLEKEINKKGNEVTYFKKLTKESEVRKNEVRSIVLKKGESLWSLAKRAYGKGHLYPKIMKANPQITRKNIRQLQIGTTIRVPL